MGCFLEGTLERRLLLAFRIGRSRPVETDIARSFRPELRGALLHRRARGGDRRQLLIIDDDLVGGVLRGGCRYRNDHGHRFTHMHHPRFGKRRTMRGDRGFSASPRNWMAVRDGMVMGVSEVG